MVIPLLLPPSSNPNMIILPVSSWLGWLGWLGRVGGVEEVGVGVVGAWSSVMIVWIRGLSWMIVGPVAGLAFFVVFRRFHVGEFELPAFIFLFFKIFLY